MSSTVIEVTTSPTDPSSRRARVACPRADLVMACRCGQELDTCHAAHCPRCGVTLHL